MSKTKAVKITCPKCGNKDDFKIWESINVQIDPQMKEQVMNKNAFLFKCPGCGEQTYVMYTLLYHDMDKKLMIYLLPDDENEIKTAAEMMSGMSGETLLPDISAVTAGYSYRIVTNITELQEKICISDAGYDDRVIEVIKVLYLGMMAEKTPDKKVDVILFDIAEDGSRRIVFIGDGEVFASAPVNEEMYNDVKDTFMTRIENNPNKYYIYDFVWARGLLT